MNKKILPLALLVFAATPLTSQAATNGADTAIDACIKAFVSTYLPNHPVRVTKTVTTPSAVPLVLQPRKYTIDLNARGSVSGAVIAEARCIADNRGIVLILDTPPANDFGNADFVARLN